MLLSGLFLWIFAIVGTGIVAVTEETTRERIVENERRILLRNLNALLPVEELDNDIVNDIKNLPASKLLGTELDSIVYRARLNDEPVAAIFNSIAPNGYNGKIHLLIGVYRDGSLAGVRAIRHRETPGLGDVIELRKSDWVLGFNGRSLTNPQPDDWAVKKDGGIFEQFTGATITPRAIVQTVKNTLIYYKQHANTVFN
ncbi:MAG: electron transport complex subunit RsxG [Gammaproteobacteria bacterium]|nr:electron transport complex subunit RsxG [Gammaproteobacteria bacterium]